MFMSKINIILSKNNSSKFTKAYFKYFLILIIQIIIDSAEAVAVRQTASAKSLVKLPI